MEKYQGWKNHATWLVALHLSNTQYIHESVQEIVDVENDNYDASKQVYDYVYDCITDVGTGQSDWGLMMMDMINSVLDDVDFVEIVESYREQ